MKTKVKILIGLVVIVVVALSTILAIKVANKKDDSQEQVAEENVPIVEEIVTPKIQIYNGTERPIAVMIDNHTAAWPQAGLQEAYAVYEIIVEGGETRLMAVFKGKNIAKIGPVRSSRHYFLDYALENNAIYTHYGWSPQAENDISKLKVNNINGLVETSKDFWRTTDKESPHNVLTSTENLIRLAEKKNYKITSSEPSILNYVAEEVNLEEGITATSVTIPYSTAQTVKYEYNPETKLYNRFARKKAQKDYESGNQITTKNIIITFVKNDQLNDGEGKDRQNLYNIGSKDGYYITNGKSIKITCEKESRTSKTIYKDLEGNVIKVNDGNTFFQICPIDAKVEIL